MTDEKTSAAFEKKTERLDIRLSHQKKQAFAQACENQGDTPSHAVRRFIATYIRRAHQDDIAARIRFLSWKRIFGVAAALVVLGFVGTVGWYKIIILEKEKLFVHYDKDKSGLIEYGEIGAEDSQLHRVLNIDGQTGISPQEFQTHGIMKWQFVDAESFKVIEESDRLFFHSVKTTMAVPVDDSPFEFTELVGYEDSQISETSDGEFSLVPITTFRMNPNTNPVQNSRYDPKFVKFDLRNPEQLELTVYAQERKGPRSESISRYQRSVIWVEGRKTPELVMGLGRENAVLTKDVKP